MLALVSVAVIKLINTFKNTNKEKQLKQKFESDPSTT